MSCKGCNYYPPKKDWPCTGCTDGNKKVLADGYFPDEEDDNEQEEP